MQPLEPKSNIQPINSPEEPKEPHMEVMPDIKDGHIIEPDKTGRVSRSLKKVLIVLLGIIILGGLVYAGYYAYNRYLVESDTSQDLLLPVTDSNTAQPTHTQPPAVAEGTDPELRDSQRISHIKQIQTALELYYTDHNQYPEVENEIVLGKNGYGCLEDKGFSPPDTCQTSVYFLDIPTNPEPGGQDYKYNSLNQDEYTLEFILELDSPDFSQGKCVATPMGLSCKKSSPPVEVDDQKEKLVIDIDTQRISHIKQIQTALELYFLDNSQYPPAPNQSVLGQGSLSCLGQNGFGPSGSCQKVTYMGRIPKDPAGYEYVYTRLVPGSYSIEFKLGIGTGILEPGMYHASPSGIDQGPASQMDTDGDGLLDEEELTLGTYIDKTDSDGDALSDFVEVNDYQTDPLDGDTDNDGYLDGQEVESGYNPLGGGKLN